MSVIQDTINPFYMAAESGLHNIDTGKSVSLETEKFLLNIDILGKHERKNFIYGCREKPERFEERIKQQKILSFATEAGKKCQNKRWKGFSCMFCKRSVWKSAHPINGKENQYG